MPFARAVRTARVVRTASRAHRAPFHRVALRLVRLVRDGWEINDLVLLGLLDPREGPARESWAVRRVDLVDAQDAVNPPDEIERMADKRRFATIAAEHGLATPPVLATLRRAGTDDDTLADWSARLRATAPEDFVVKPLAGMSARGVRVLRRDGDGVADHAGVRMRWRDLAAAMLADAEAYVLQPRLRPHPALRELTGQEGLHTLRIITLMPRGGPPEVLYAVLRIVTGGAAVDNFRVSGGGVTGNLIARVTADGTLAAPFRAAPDGHGLVRVHEHPDTGRRLTGVRVPDWDACVALALRAAAAFPKLPCPGWDIAPTDRGPVIVEGNGGWRASADPDGELVTLLGRLRQAAGERGGRERQAVR